ncbi:MAG TPA: gamma-glutamyltransferase [Methylomirabilota bacterium]|jgi:gamma-glutamyltranspeptidase/glutathione hydrolase|nr:gamma-glutamyltransferase [Methylomirabilota bacterium]
MGAIGRPAAWKTTLLVGFLFLRAAGTGQAASPFAATGTQVMVASANRQATEAGLEILRKGGNAVDAAVAVGYALGVGDPYHSGIGGGGFMVVRLNTGDVHALDFRETAPRAAHREMYLKGGKVVPGLSTEGPLAVAVPGIVAGYAEALRRFGTMTLKDVLAPAVRLAEQGPVVTPYYTSVVADQRIQDLLRRFPESAGIFLPGGLPPAVGDLLVQKDLARTYRLIADRGAEVFYRGEIAEAIVRAMRARGGLITKNDLASYQVKVRAPVGGSYRGFEIVSMPPPSSGGTHVIQILNILEGYDVAKLGRGSSALIHLAAEAMKRAFADRAEFMGDPDFVVVPVAGLLSKSYAADRRRDIDPDRATVDVKSGTPRGAGGTSHFSVVDRRGNVVAVTQTINTHFGSGLVAPGTGIVLNNEMDDFAAAAGVPNAFGLLGGAANAIAPGKRPLSSMSPTIVIRDGKPRLAVGCAGGPRIITSVVAAVVNVIDFGMTVQEAVDFPRYHSQGRGVWVEREVPESVREGLIARGHTVEERPHWSRCQAISIDPATGHLFGAADSRQEGSAAGF